MGIKLAAEEEEEEDMAYEWEATFSITSGLHEVTPNKCKTRCNMVCPSHARSSIHILYPEDSKIFLAINILLPELTTDDKSNLLAIMVQLLLKIPLNWTVDISDRHFPCGLVLQFSCVLFSIVHICCFLPIVTILLCYLNILCSYWVSWVYLVVFSAGKLQKWHPEVC